MPTAEVQRFSNLMKLLGTSTLEKVVVWKCLEPCGFSYGSNNMFGIGVNESRAQPFTYMARNGAAGLVKALNLEPVNKLALPVCMCRR